MGKTLTAQTDPPGVGLAANQVGLNLSLFIIKPTAKSLVKVFINPKIVKVGQSRSSQLNQSKSDSQSQLNRSKSVESVTNSTDSTNLTKKRRKRIKLEGCLSIPRIWGPAKRAERIFLHYRDLTGKKYLKWFSGFEAMIIQHEVDHLNGIVFTQRSLEQNLPIYKEKDGQLEKITDIS